MKFIYIVMAAVMPLSAYAGPGASGGGNETIAQFVAQADSLITMFPWQDNHKKLLGDALIQSRIISTPVLKDPTTDQPIPNQQQLVAWTSPGLIQVKEESLNSVELSFAKLWRDKKMVAHQIAHELFRASGQIGADGRSIDDVYQLSVIKYHLDTYDLSAVMSAAKPQVSTHMNDVTSDAAKRTVVKHLNFTDRVLKYLQARGFKSGCFMIVNDVENGNLRAYLDAFTLPACTPETDAEVLSPATLAVRATHLPIKTKNELFMVMGVNGDPVFAGDWQKGLFDFESDLVDIHINSHGLIDRMGISSAPIFKKLAVDGGTLYWRQGVPTEDETTSIRGIEFQKDDRNLPQGLSAPWDTSPYDYNFIYSWCTALGFSYETGKPIYAPAGHPRHEECKHVHDLAKVQAEVVCHLLGFQHAQNVEYRKKNKDELLRLLDFDGKSQDAPESYLVGAVLYTVECGNKRPI